MCVFCCCFYREPPQKNNSIKKESVDILKYEKVLRVSNILFDQ